MQKDLQLERPLQRETSGRGDGRRTWRMIAATAAAALLCWGASFAILRAFAQETPPAAPPAAPAAASLPADSNEAEEVKRRATAPKSSDEEAPEFRDSADNNISLPVDI